jgi:hypothetical protein
VIVEGFEKGSAEIRKINQFVEEREGRKKSIPPT